jgi:hypothetical protein
MTSPLPTPHPGFQVRITAPGYGDLSGRLTSVDHEGMFYVGSPYGDCEIGPLHSTDLAVLCGWFLACPSGATSVVSHPILGEVPVCDSCLKFTAPRTSYLD